MVVNNQFYLDNLNNEDISIRLYCLKQLIESVSKGDIPRLFRLDDVNNHIHTFYSFSPYSPAKAIWMAYSAGLSTAGIMDHDSVSGAREFIKAGEIAEISTTIGAECRVDFSNTSLAGRWINNPDQKGIAYMTIQGIPHTQIERIKEFFIPYTAERNKRNIRMTERINDMLGSFGINIDYEKDVKPLSKWREHGSITERHILFALSHIMINQFGKGQELTDFIHSKLKIELSIKNEQYLLNKRNIYYDYYLLGVLKSGMVEQFYIDAKEECPDVRDLIQLCTETEAIAAYAYLGDVQDSVTGDKKRQNFEDEYLEELFETVKKLGFHAITYIPSRNTQQQLIRVRHLCEHYKLIQISGEDINSPRQKFVCDVMRNSEMRNLVDSTWALIGHEKAATKDLHKGMFSEETIRKYPILDDRIQQFKKIGLEDYYHTKGGTHKC